MTGIELIPLATGGDLSLPVLAAALENVLALDVTLSPITFDIDSTYDSSRLQYHSTKVLSLIIDHAPAGNSRLLGITSVDLFIPILTYVFGQAQLANRAAVFSYHRLRNEKYGLPPSADLLQERALKEALHELGHTFGLRHCFDHPCAMNTSTYVEDIDLKPAHYCAQCAESVHRFVHDAPDAFPQA